jgi:diguanylate cyclase (GGDEF)-like protein
MIGNAHQRMGRHFESLDYYQTELRFLEMMGANQEQIGTRNALASVFYNIGDYPAAMESASAGALYRRRDRSPPGAGSALNLLGNLYFKRGDNLAAIDSYERSLAVFTETGDLYWQAGVMGNCANVCLEVGDHDRALEMHYASLYLRQEVKDRQGQAYSLLNLGSFYIGKQSVDKDTDTLSPHLNPALALRFFKKGLRLFGKVSDKQGAASCLVQIGGLYLSAGRSSKALFYGCQALALAEETGSREHLYESHLLLSKAYEHLRDFERALTHHKQFHAVKEAVFNAENEERVRNLEVIHRVAQARRDTEIHRRLSGRLAVTNKALQAADSEKALLLIKLRQQAGLLEIQARTDALTGLLNRRTLDTRLEEEWERARQENSRLCIVLCDIDRFKQINDQFSHQVGDAVLRQVSRLFQQALRTTDTSARYGGEEFVFILPDTTLEEAMSVCESIRRSISAYDWSQIQPGLIVTVSLGLCEASVSPSGISAEQALRVADTALYQAKHQGRDRICHAVIAV